MRDRDKDDPLILVTKPLSMSSFRSSHHSALIICSSSSLLHVHTFDDENDELHICVSFSSSCYRQFKLIFCKDYDNNIIINGVRLCIPYCCLKHALV